MLHNLAKFGHDVELFVMGPSARRYILDEIYVNVVPYPSLIRRLVNCELTQTIISRTHTKYGFLSLIVANPSMANYAKELIRSSDAVVIEDRFQLFPLLYAKLYGKPCVMDLLGFFLLYVVRYTKKSLKNPIIFLKILPVITMEILTLLLSTKIVVSSKEDKTGISQLLHIRPSKIDVITDGIDDKAFRPDEEQRKSIRLKYRIDNEKIIVAFVGDLRSPHNFYATKYIVKRLAPAIFEKYFDRVYFLIVGPYDKIPDHFLRDKRIVFTNFVDSVVPYINAADICIAPLTQGAGMKTKTLGYMACRKAVVTTMIGGEGLDLKNKQNAIICDIESMEDELIRLIEDEKIREILGRNARIKASKYSWKEKALELQKTLQGILGKTCDLE
jgi:glycosyltransferase involved in cell wall biosynthesis